MSPLTLTQITATASPCPRPSWATRGRWSRIEVTDGTRVLVRTCSMSARDLRALADRYRACVTWSQVEAVA